jgi:hypothetical protein
MVSELERKRTEIERRIGKEFCRTAAARRRKIKNDANLLAAFGNILSMPQSPSELGRLSTEAQGGGSHGER